MQGLQDNQEEILINGINMNELVRNDLGIYAPSEKPADYSENFTGNLCPSCYPRLLELLIKSNATKKIREFFNRFESQIVLDLGANSSHLYNLISGFNVEGYVGVEVFHDEKLINSLKDSFNKKKIPFAVVREDMLNFLKRVPSNSVSVHVSGIDDEIIPDQNYQKEVIKEIARVLHPRGIYTEYQGIEIGRFDAEKFGLKKIVAECDAHGYFKN